MDESQAKELEQRTTDKYSAEDDWGEGFAELEALKAKEELAKPGQSDKKTAKMAKKSTDSLTKRQPRVRSKKYLSLKKQIDRAKLYSLKDAIQKTLDTAKTNFDASIELHVMTKKSQISGDLKLPYPIGKKAVIEIFSLKTIAKIEAKKLDFDILLAKPEDMPKIAKFARILGPKGLMPNPKNGTITQEPDKKAKQLLAGGSLQYKTEKKAPLLHLVIGKRSFGEQKIAANLKAIISTLNPKQLNRASLSSSMGPGVKLDLQSFL